MRKTLLFAVVFGVCLEAAPISSLYFFGDSLSDTGNVYAATSFLNAATFGLVSVTPASPPYYNGHFSNGPVLAETVAQRFGRPADAAPAGMSLGVFGSLPGSGHNYSVGGARNGTGGALGSLDSLIPTGIQAQVAYYTSGHTADPNAMYLMLGGGNDLRDAAALTDFNAQMAAMNTAAVNMAIGVYELYQAGARNFFLMNGPNIGFIPESLVNGRVQSGYTASLLYNYFLDSYATALRGLPGLQLTEFDLFSAYNDLFGDTLTGGAKYGFTTLAPCIANQAACGTSMFFDDIHPTARVHQILGNMVADRLLAVGAPAGSSLLSVMDDAAAAATPEPASAVLLLAGAALLTVRTVVRARAS